MGQGFNPHPARWPGATRALYRVVRSQRVSILTQHAGRVRPRLARCPAPACGCFNPHPARWPGATSWGSSHVRHLGSVSILTQHAGRVRRTCAACPGRLAGVSILTQHAGRVRPQAAPVRCVGTASFNPHPARWPGATASARCPYSAGISFNPHPARWPGATMMVRSFPAFTLFQSSPSTLAGCDARPPPPR